MLIQVIFYVAIAAEAMTAALAAGRRSMDWFGVCVLACVTALGGGTARDVLLGHYPLSWVQNPYLLVLCCAAAFVPIALARYMAALRWPFLLLDAIGLVAFTIIGCNVALDMGQQPIIVVVAGLITGIVGGILRDVLCNDVPLVFSSELYATVAIVSGVLYYFGHISDLPLDIVIIGVIVVGVTLRVLAIVFKLQMPKFVYDKELR
ncbi:MAG: trimeric intracellular cation channel family protein [Devosia sp.]|uniref:trimeric intracellular cation channel family protein n=1 Tax=Devosia sp. TaxID=1871048 RepID=UPI001AD0EBAC|nr:trimeric intracellular cation channel family protein [Devosia sp.]MBN9310745.1 trimeric intracellular cation channel family protein [Devosia sp.]MBN9315506.1 trimeric intracellular cation channel family protein [Devosia sp.]